ncbi:rhodanese-like domain-containing protein [Gloeocapsopsis crepidinum LEGE 06123]|uniref:Rhodanese-like domain-containing protein n=1 Tax=Gloeocapsopsis crepidinum LEGE 06123 TaxID=588587 RepID=A0ABR9UN42_9CHRO|nr:rhodanese-like domain-containing protein [Gloeocapsopsis crepidinum]MBE9188798.1 rhodanese-like domain-containing protein [Gloeocapsopsis crepidinum LEGE 06123]
MTATKEKLSDRLQTVDAKTLKHWIDEGTVDLIDVREPSEYASEHIPSAKLVSLSKFDPSEISNTHKKLIIHCQSGNRSAQAAQKLLANGFEQVTHLQGGISAWKQAGYPTEVNKNAPISLMRQVQIVAGSLVLLGTLLSVFISPWFLILSGFVGAGLTFAGITGNCGLAMLLAKLPYNQTGIN